MARFLPTNGNSKDVTAKTLDEMQKLVGGFVEPVRLPDGRMMLVDEDGISKNSEVNMVASHLAGGRILGDVIVYSVDEWKEMEFNDGD
jgi:hypothetical protein